VIVGSQLPGRSERRDVMLPNQISVEIEGIVAVKA
jgi:hypothetical protein